MSNFIRKRKSFAILSLWGILFLAAGCQQQDPQHLYTVLASADCYSQKGKVWTVKSFSERTFEISSTVPFFEKPSLKEVFGKVAGTVTRWEYRWNSALDDYDYLPVSIPYNNFDFAILRVSYSDATLPLAAASSGMRTLFVLSDHSGDLSFWNDCPGDIFTKKELMNIISTAVPERE